MTWLESVSSIGAQSNIDIAKAAKFLGDALGVPSDLIVQDVLPPVLAAALEKEGEDV